MADYERDNASTLAIESESLQVEADATRKKRRKLFTGLALALAVGGGGYFALFDGDHVSTDNAYVNADVAQVTPLVAGAVASVNVVNTQTVKRGEILFRLDDADQRLAVMRAEADLARAKRQFGQIAATSGALSAQVAAGGAEIGRANAQMKVASANYEKARVDLDRRRKLADSGAVSGEELTAAINSFASAEGNLALARAGVTQAGAGREQARGSLAANNALIVGSTVNSHPDVESAEARLRQARLDLERTVIRAPIDGVVTSRQVQIGQRINAGQQAMTIVPVGAIYVDANFKEGQLGRVRVGQKVELVSDLYGSDVLYHGRVTGFSGGTGSAFALIPAQNATGNWIKVVQRLPVRVAIDPRELVKHPLRVGLSMEASIDVSGKE